MPAMNSKDRQDRSAGGWQLASSESLESEGGVDRVTLKFVDNSGIPAISTNLGIDELARLFGPILNPHVEILRDGSIAIEVEFVALPQPADKGPDIAQLVSRALEPEMLEDEPDVRVQLSILRERLTEALALVDRTLADLDKPA